MSTVKPGLTAGSWKQLTLPILLLAILLGGVVFAVASRILLGSLQKLEDEAARQVSLQVEAAFAFDTEHLQRMATTYAEWDETIAYVRGESSDYLHNNYTPSLLESIDVDHVWILDKEGRVFGSATRRDSPSEVAVPVDSRLTQELGRFIGNQFELRNARPERSFLDLSGQLYSIAARKITRSDLSGDGGTLIFARQWMQGRIGRIAELSRRELSVSQPLPGEDPGAILHAQRDGNMHVHAWLLQPDGVPAAVVDIGWKRDLLLAARRATLVTIVILVAGFVALAGLLALRLRRSEDAVLQHQQSMADQLRTDALTGLRNRVALEDISKTVLSSKGAAVLYIDVDRFKALNDSLGHGVGDEILRVVARRLRAIAGQHDHVVRLGGDEFLMVFTDIESRDITARLVQRVRDQFLEHLQAAESSVHVTLSMGAALYPCDGSTLAEAIRSADLALYEAKSAGRNGYRIYDADMGRRRTDADALREALEHAVRDRRISVVYQPQHGTTSGELTGLEALARWHDPVLGAVPPSRFIPLAEQHGLIDALGQQVILAVCGQIHDWRSRGVPVSPVSINLSPRQFDSGTLIEFIQEATRRFGVEPQMLTFEITESVFMDQTGAHANALHHLRSMGFRIAIDDFGTGYSSLSYLRLLPVSTIKIDRSFVHDLDGTEAGSALVRSILDIAYHFNLGVVAEGVETHAQLARLRELRCENVQGYFLNRPMSASECEQVLIAKSARMDTSTTQPLRIVK